MTKKIICLITIFTLLLPATAHAAKAANSYAESSVRVEVNANGESKVFNSTQVSTDGESLVINSDEAKALRQQRQQDFEEQQAATDLKVQARSEAIQVEREERQARLCATVQNRLQAHTNQYQQISDSYLQRLRQVARVLQALTDRLAATEIDTTDLQAMMAKLNTDANSFEERVQTHLGSLEDVTNAACHGQEAEYRLKMQNMRTEFVQIKNEATAIKDYIKNIIRPELDAIKLQISQNQPAVEM